MAKIKLDKLNETVEEISAEPMLITNAINQNNAKTHGLHKTLINKIKDGNSKQYRLSENLKETISGIENGFRFFFVSFSTFLNICAEFFSKSFL